MNQPVQVTSRFPKACPGCGSVYRLYRTPHGLRCEDCVRKMDSSGLGFR